MPMKRFLLLIFLLSIVVWVGVGYYFFFVVKGKNTLFVNENLNWSEYEDKIIKDCSEVPFFDTKQDTVIYLLNILSDTDSIIYDNELETFVSIDKQTFFSMWAIGKNKDFSEMSRDPRCWMIWVGDSDGNGKVYYEGNNDSIKSVDIYGFSKQFSK